MLILPIKKKWFDMILSGEKKEEYREIKPYYTKRFENIGVVRVEEHGGPMTNDEIGTLFIDNMIVWKEKNPTPFCVLFRNGYSADSPSFVAQVTLKLDEGKVEWGAEPRVVYYVLQIENVLKY